MRSAVFVVLLFISLALAQSGPSPLYAVSGNTAVSTIWPNGYPDVNTDGSDCSSNGTSNGNPNTTYVAFPVVFSTTGVRQLVVLADSTLDDEYNVFIYNGTFNASAGCVNLWVVATSQTLVEDGPQVDDFFLFAANVNYTFVLSPTSSSTQGNFVAHIYDSVATGASSLSVTWTTAYNSSSGENCDTYSDNVPYVSFAWTQSTTGYFDLIAGWAYNTTDGWSETVLALYSGNATNATINIGCADTYIVGYVDEYRGPRLLGFPLQANTTYTLVTSANSNVYSLSSVGFFVQPTRLLSGNQTGFTLPSTSDGECADNTIYTNATWAAVAINNPPAGYTFAIGVVADIYSSYILPYEAGDSVIYAYNVSNLGSGTSAPNACTPVQWTTSYPTSSTVNLATGLNYTFVAASYDNADTWYENYNSFYVYVLTGPTLGANFSTSTSSGTGSGSGTGTGSLTTGGANIATGAHATITANITTGSPASAVVCSFAFVVLAAVAALL